MVYLNRFPGHREMKGQGCINKQLERTPDHPDHPNVLDSNTAGAFPMCVTSLSLAHISSRLSVSSLSNAKNLTILRI